MRTAAPGMTEKLGQAGGNPHRAGDTAKATPAQGRSSRHCHRPHRSATGCSWGQEEVSPRADPWRLFQCPWPPHTASLLLTASAPAQRALEKPPTSDMGWWCHCSQPHADASPSDPREKQLQGIWRLGPLVWNKKLVQTTGFQAVFGDEYLLFFF